MNIHLNSLVQAIIEVDLESFNNIIEARKLLVGYDLCKVWDAIEVRRCFKCSGFNHVSNQCRQKDAICPKCAGNHLLQDCQSNDLKCIHCSSLIDKNPDININHAAWDVKSCSVYRKQVDKLRSLVLGAQ